MAEEDDDVVERIARLLPPWLSAVDAVNEVIAREAGIMDYGKFKYEQNLRARKAKKNQHQMQLKEVKMRPKIEDHDYNFKLRHAREFLEERNKVKFTVTFRGREMAHQELGHKIIQAILTDLADIALVETPARQEGRTLSMVMTPKAGKPVEPKKATPEGKPSEQAPQSN